MSEERLILAIGRLERAIARVESAAGSAASGVDQNAIAEAQAALQSLEARHARLKRSVEGAIGALDNVIAKAE